MLKQFVHRSAIALAFTVLAVPAGRMYAQSAGAPVVTGGDPVPTGENAVMSGESMALIVLGALGTV